MIWIYAGDLAHQLSDGSHCLPIRWKILDCHCQS